MDVLNWASRPEEALQAMEQAMQLNPRRTSQYLVDLGAAYHMTGRYTEATATLKEANSRNPNYLYAHVTLAFSYLDQWGSQQSPAAHTLELAEVAAQRALALKL